MQLLDASLDSAKMTVKAKGGNMIVYGEDEESSLDAALLLAGFFRIWPTEMSLAIQG